MNENSDLLPNLLHEEFEMQMRGYSRRQVDEFVARRNNEIRDLEQRLARTLDETEQLRREISAVRQQALASKPAHEEVSERIAQILKLADDEAKAQKGKADEEIAKLREDAQQEAERVRADAREQAERMLTAAQEQAERTISAARNEADKTRTSARTEADRLTTETRKKADSALASAKAQAKKMLDEATARASAIHDGAERRLNLLSTRHADTVRRLTDILDGVQGLVAAEAARMSLEEEVNQSVASAAAAADAGETAGAGDDDGDEPASERDLATMAPPAPDTIASGAAAPPVGDMQRRDGASVPPRGADNGGPDKPGQPAAADREPAANAAAAGQFPPVRPGPALPPPGPMPHRLGAPVPEGAPRGGIPMPSGQPRSGPGVPVPGSPGHGDGAPDLDALGTIIGGAAARGVPDRDTPVEGNRGSHTGLIDPDEPTEGIRLMR
jgi:cell division septum initiation protein DivIVA